MALCGKASSSTEDTGGRHRERWSSRLAFYFAAVGSAVGFGNVWRFPSLCREYGGGAFFVPYLMALFLIGIPVLTLEISLGQYYQTGDVGAFGSIHKRLRGVGVISVACGYMLVTYYSMLLAWVTNAFFDSFGDNFWAQDEVTGGEANDYFFNEIIGMSTLGSNLRPTRMVGPNAGYSALVWFIIYLCTAFGISWTGRITYITMGLPIILLFVFLGRALTLEGHGDGIKEYIGIWDMSVLSDQPDVWSTAVTQIFFSLSVTFGIMTAYGSHCERTEPAFINSIVISFANSMFSFISGFAVFAALGHLSYLENKEISELPFSGFGLVFASWPVVLGTLDGGEHWIRLLFFDLFLLGLDSAFSFVEGFLVVVQDTTAFQNVKRPVACAVLCLTAYLLSLLYATDAGLIFLDTVDFYINFVMLLVGFFETFSAGWVYGINDQIACLGPKIVFAYIFANFGSVLFASGLWFGLGNDNAVWAGFLGLILLYAASMAYVVYLLKQKIESEPDRWTWKTILYELSFRNVMDLKTELEVYVKWIPTVWAVLMKQFIPHILLILFINLASSDNDKGESLFGHYGTYVAWPYQVLGILIVAFVLVLFLVGLFVPSLYSCLALSEGAIEKQSVNVKDDQKEILVDEEFADEEGQEENPEVEVVD
mmetsp:Transcript_4829/g.6585  ORF Transcript_4829/g.6585 Transcript_4829/m.6585 type:complete len:653 (-) Transcript_4829:296-2254(-)|eukprot:CAMPEP_0185729134 /NCGR_PEP_ID=MMETSP1171-20130828/4486_1 /TAXON_ID=374046 /ORGANISM="Helicotheca tamensis, Strain CCMP826" /LENGTH=652 /DNA_ID=CAMNT_0028397911 /DNA_START=63 /DNA_END=2021 /DNA_ORIENTATION=-